ncbi:hypothetical protein D3C81_1589260 [compost metagenome]
MFVDVGEVADLHEVDQIRIAAADVRIRIVATHALVAETQSMATEAIGKHRAEGLVIELAEVAVLCATRIAHIAFQ